LRRRGTARQTDQGRTGQKAPRSAHPQGHPENPLVHSSPLILRSVPFMKP
jgi:hypothetical protein